MNDTLALPPMIRWQRAGELVWPFNHPLSPSRRRVAEPDSEQLAFSFDAQEPEIMLEAAA